MWRNDIKCKYMFYVPTEKCSMQRVKISVCALTQCFVPNNRRKLCLECHLKSTFCVKHNFEHANLNSLAFGKLRWPCIWCCHCLHPSLFHTATSLLIWYKMFCMRDVSYRLIWMKFINIFSVYAQSGMHRRFNWWIIAVLTYNPSVLMCVEITDAPKL